MNEREGVKDGGGFLVCDNDWHRQRTSACTEVERAKLEGPEQSEGRGTVAKKQSVLYVKTISTI